MNLLVTGGTGFVGTHLIRELLKEKENTVYALVRDRKKLEHLDIRDRVTAIAGDLFASEPFPPDIDMVFHLAALTKVVSPQEFFHCNQQGTLALLDRLKPLKKLRKMVLLSSLAAAGPNRQIPCLTEGMPDNPVSLYGRSKLAQEKIIQAHSPVPYIIIRAPIVFGPGDMDMLTIFRVLKKGILPELGRQRRLYSVIYVTDLVKGMIAAAKSPCQNETFYIANADPVSWDDFMLAAHQPMGGDIRKLIIPKSLARILAEISEIRIRVFNKKKIFNRDKFREMRFPVWTCSAEKSSARLHFQPQHSTAVALKETVRWYQEQNLL